MHKTRIGRAKDTTLGGRATVSAAIALAAAVVLGMAATPAAAAIIPFVANPQTNSTDWATAVTGSGKVITTLNFDTLTAGALPLDSKTGNYVLNDYLVSNGVSFSVAGTAAAITNGAGPSGMGTYRQNAGEGLHAVSNYVNIPASATTEITVDFVNPVSAAGFFSIDLASWKQNGLSLTIEAFSGASATGTSLGVATSYDPAFFQPNHLYFMGLRSTASDIKSIQIRGGWAGNSFGMDDFKFGQVPEPAGMCLLGLAAASLLTKRRLW